MGVKQARIYYNMRQYAINLSKKSKNFFSTWVIKRILQDGKV
jgi:hypothetical protein